MIKRKILKKIVTVAMAAVMTLEVIPIWSAPILAEESEKAYEIVVEPTIDCDDVYGRDNGYIKVRKYENDEYDAKLLIC